MKHGKYLDISISSILTVLVFFTQFISLSYFSWYNMLRYATILILGKYVILRIKMVLRRKYLLINCTALLFGMLTVYTSYLNRDRGADRDPFLAALVFIASMLLFLLFMEIMAEQFMVGKTLNILFKTALAVTVITDILLLFAPSLFQKSRQYFVGTKFGVVYLHLLLIIFYLAKVNLDENILLNKKILIVLAAWSFFIGICVGCSTGIVGVFILLGLLFIINKNRELFMNGIFFSVVQGLCFGFAFFYEFILSNSFVKNFIVNILGKDITLTYRTVIYEKVPQILTSQNAWMRGMGYGSSYELGMKYGGLSDTQNGILEWIWQTGIPTTIVMAIFFAAILFVSSKYINDLQKKIMMPFLAGLYLLTILGTVEITIGKLYFSLVICIVGITFGNTELSNEYDDEDIQGELRDEGL